MKTVDLAELYEKHIPYIRVPATCQNSNIWGTLHGGFIMTQIDNASGVIASHYANQKVLTAGIKEIKFHHPVKLDDMLLVYAEVVKTGRSSIVVEVEVLADHLDTDKQELSVYHVASAEVTYVTVNDQGRPCSIARDKRKVVYL